MSDKIDMIPIDDAARMIGVHVSTARGWVMRGTIAGVVRHGPRGLLSVPRAEVDRIRAEREARAQASKSGPASWQPMTDRLQAHGHAHDDGEGQHP